MRGTDVRLRWKERSRQHVTSSPLFDLFTSRRTSGTGKTGEFYILEAPDWVTIVPVVRTPGQEDLFLMVRQYRHGADMITTEFPAGIVEPGEDPLRAAARELEEETGFRAGRMTPLGRVCPNPAFMNNWCSTYLAEDLARVGSPTLDPTEEMDVLQVPARSLRESIGTGELVNSLTLVALMWYERAQSGRNSRDASP
jgi:8-oxo-dGTP pyrophosphatase MutT (NUDIX family)